MVDVRVRVPVWNNFFALAQEAAKRVSETAEKYQLPEDGVSERANLPEEEVHVLATVVLCNLAIEARVNDLIEEMIAEGRLSGEAADAARQLPTKHKWYLLPALAGRGTLLGTSSGPHQAIAELCDLRDACVQVSYDQLLKRLPRPQKVLSWFERFMEAMADLDVVLGREHAGPGMLEVGSLGRM